LGMSLKKLRQEKLEILRRLLPF